MADNEIRNPAKAYFKWKMPVIAKSEDDWNFWNTEDKYNRTMFIGYNDTTTPHVASLFMIVDGKPMQAVGDDVIARIAGMETNMAQALADIQALIDRTNAQQLNIDALKQECYRILNSAKDAVTDAQTWAEGTDEEVADLGGEHSAKGWAQKANEIVSSGLPSDATLDYLTVTGSSKFGQDPDRENQPGLEIESTGEIQAYRTVNMMNGATVSYDETVEMPWSDSSNKVPNTAWVQQAVQHGTIDPNTELTVKSITTTTGGGSLSYTEDWLTNVINVAQTNYPRMELSSTKYNRTTSGKAIDTQARIQLDSSRIYANATAGMKFAAGVRGLGNDCAYSFLLENTALADKLYFLVYPRAALGHGLLVGGCDTTPVALDIWRDADDSNNWKAKFFITPTVPDIANASDSSSKVPNTKWVQAAIAAGGGTGGGAVTSVNGKTGEVVLAAADVGAATTADITTALEPYAKTADVTTTLVDYAKSADVTTEITTATAGLQPKLTAGANITISEDNVISATGGGTGGGAVDSVNGKTGAVVLTSEDVNIDTTAGATTVKDAIAAKQDAINTGTDLDVRSLKALSTIIQEGETQQYTMAVTGEGFELADATNNISWAWLTPTGLNVPSLVANGAPGVDTVLTCNGTAKIAALSSVNIPYATGAFKWDINTTTDYNKFEVYNTYYTTDAKTGSTVANRYAVFSIGGSPDNRSTWIDFNATYMSFKGNTNFGETGMDHIMNFNGPSTFNNEATFTRNITLGHGETTVEGEGGTSTTTPASFVLVEGDMVAYGNATFSKGLSTSGMVHLNDVTFWREVSGGIIPSASYSYSTGAFDIGYLTSNDSSNGKNRVTIMADSREANYGAVFNLPVTVSDASFKRTSTLAADDNSTEVPTTAWVAAAIAASGGVPENLSVKSLEVTNYDSSLNSIKFAGNLTYTGDAGNGSLGKITANELFTNASGYYGTRVQASGITLTHGVSSTTWFKADSDAETLTIRGKLKSSTPAADADNTEVATTAWVNTAITNKANTDADNFSTAGKAVLAGMGMPSAKYIDLTLGASGATYTAPANGWFTINKHTVAGKQAAFENKSAGGVTWIAQVSVETDCRTSCPAQAGDIVQLWYSADGNLNLFRFVYAEGSQPAI
jgi:hypothetical protein|nr:MAG TPA: hypothetical protein [Caudoviricetes sp.]